MVVSRDDFGSKFLPLLRQQKGIHVHDADKIYRFVNAVWFRFSDDGYKERKWGYSWRGYGAMFGDEGGRALNKKYLEWKRKGIWEILYYNLKDELEFPARFVSDIKKE